MAARRYILGEAPGVHGFFVAAGFNSAGIANAAGAGLLMAEWLSSGHPGRDVWGVDIRRFAPFHSNGAKLKLPTPPPLLLLLLLLLTVGSSSLSSAAFLRDRCAEVLGLHYQMPWPRRELASARGMRRTPLYATHAASGAIFGQKFGWERVNYFIVPTKDESSGVPLTPDAHAEAVAAAAVPTVATPPNWLAHARREHLHTRRAVTLFDVSHEDHTGGSSSLLP